ncbi:MAG: hypothetical protein IJ688_14780 [Treponema sp.]|nr:hypothetical protein [Treponema sp.]
MMKDFRKKTKERMEKLVKEKGLKLYTMKIFIGECSESNFETICNFLIEMWRKMYVNHSSIFFSHFAGFTRELIIEIDGNICRPYLFFVLFANKNNLPTLAKLKNLAFFSVLRTNNLIDRFDARQVYDKVIVPLEEVPPEQYDKILDDLMNPCVRVINPNERLEELVEMYQYNRQLCSRGGIVSKKNLERNVSLEQER